MMTKEELKQYERLENKFCEHIDRITSTIYKCKRYADALDFFTTDFVLDGDEVFAVDEEHSCRFPSSYLTMTYEELNAEVERIIKEEREEAERQKKNLEEQIKNKDLYSLKAILERHPEWKGKTVEEI